MTIDAISATASTPSLTTGRTAARVPKQEMDGELFLKLLVTQLSHQDPSSPMDTNAMISQTTELATMERLTELATRLKAAGSTTFDQEATTCCYAKSDKSWVTDTAGVRWETFFTHGEATAYGEDEVIPVASAKSACC